MSRRLSLVTLIAVLFASPAFAADPIIGTWKLNVAKSKFSPNQVLTAGSRVYTESAGVYTLEQKTTSAAGKEVANVAQYSEGKEQAQGPGQLQTIDTVLAKKVNANTWNFVLKKDGKTVGHVHRVVSPDGKTLTVHNTGVSVSSTSTDETLVYDKQ
jgi:ABC-type sugar transport system substrate-binding protein